MSPEAVAKPAEAEQQNQTSPQEGNIQDAFADSTFSGDEPGSNAQSPESGKASPPASEQAGNSGKSGEETQTPSGDEAGQGDVSEESLKEALSFTRTPEETQKSLKTQLSAASKESRWNNAVNKEIQNLLKQQGLELSVDKVKNDRNEEVPNISLSLKKGYKPEADGFEFKYSDLPEEQQEQFMDDPQKLIDTVVEQAKSAFARALPAGEKKPSVSRENIDAAFEFLSKQKDASGEDRYPGIADEQTKSLINGMIDDPSASDGLKSLMAKDPELGVELLNARVAAERQRLLSQAEKARQAKAAQDKQANADGSVMPASGGTQKETGGNAGDYFSDYLMD